MRPRRPPVGTATLAWHKSGAAQNEHDGAGAKTPPLPATAADQLVVDAAVFNGVTQAAGPAPGDGQTLLWSTNKSTTQGGSSTSPGGSSAVSWTPAGTSGVDWAIIAEPLNPAG